MFDVKQTCHFLNNLTACNENCFFFIQIKLKGAEVVPDVSIGEGKYVIKLFIPGIEGMQEYWLRCDTVSFILFLIFFYLVYIYSILLRIL